MTEETLTCVICHKKVFVYESNKLVASPKMGYSGVVWSDSKRYKYWCPCCKEEGRFATREMANVSVMA